MTSRVRSSVWNYFSKVSKDRAKCEICSSILSIKGGSSTNLLRHAKSKHPTKVNQLFKIVPTKPQDTSGSELPALDQSMNETNNAAALAAAAQGLPTDTRRWSYEESLNLIKVVTKGKIEEPLPNSNLHHSNHQISKEFWKKMKTQLESLGVYAQQNEIQKKWNNLVRTYRVCSRKRGMNRRRFRFYEEMSDFFNVTNSISAENSDNDLAGCDDEVPEYTTSYNGNSYETLNEEDYHNDIEGDDDQGRNNIKTEFIELQVAGNDDGDDDDERTTQESRISENLNESSSYMFSEKQFERYMKMKRSEYERRQERHVEKMRLKSEELELQKAKLELLKNFVIAGNQHRAVSSTVVSNNDNYQESSAIENVYLISEFAEN